MSDIGNLLAQLNELKSRVIILENAMAAQLKPEVKIEEPKAEVPTEDPTLETRPTRSVSSGKYVKKPQ